MTKAQQFCGHHAGTASTRREHEGGRQEPRPYQQEMWLATEARVALKSGWVLFFPLATMSVSLNTRAAVHEIIGRAATVSFTGEDLEKKMRL